MLGLNEGLNENESEGENEGDKLGLRLNDMLELKLGEIDWLGDTDDEILDEIENFHLN